MLSSKSKPPDHPTDGVALFRLMLSRNALTEVHVLQCLHLPNL